MFRLITHLLAATWNAIRLALDGIEKRWLPKMLVDGDVFNLFGASRSLEELRGALGQQDAFQYHTNDNESTHEKAHHYLRWRIEQSLPSFFDERQVCFLCVRCHRRNCAVPSQQLPNSS